MSDKKHKHEHHHRKPHVDLKKHRVYLDSKIYQWEDRKGDWVGGAGGHFLIERDWVRYRRKDDATGRVLNDSKSKDRHLIRKLDSAVEREEDRKHRQKTQQPVRLEDVEAFEAASDKLGAILGDKPESESASAEESASAAEKHAPTAEQAVKRDKHGVRLYSNDDKHFFNIGVYKSRKESNSSTVCLFVAGRPFTYTLNKSKMEEFIREVIRTSSAKDLGRLIEHSRPT
jgi:hypothetical protein